MNNLTPPHVDPWLEAAECREATRITNMLLNSDDNKMRTKATELGKELCECIREFDERARDEVTEVMSSRSPVQQELPLSELTIHYKPETCIQPATYTVCCPSGSITDPLPLSVASPFYYKGALYLALSSVFPDSGIFKCNKVDSSPQPEPPVQRRD